MAQPATFTAPTVPRLRRPSGFTLIEVMIVVAIIGILAAIALPAYTDYIRRSELPEAFTFLSNQRVAMEQFYQDNRHYGLTSCAEGKIAFSDTPAKGAKFSYACKLSGNNGNQAYTLTATGTSGHTTGHEYTLNEAGLQGTTRFKGASVSGKECWLKRSTDEC